MDALKLTEKNYSKIEDMATFLSVFKTFNPALSGLYCYVTIWKIFRNTNPRITSDEISFTK